MLRLFQLNRLQRKVMIVVLTIVVVPMLLAGGLAAAWVSSYFEQRLEQWIVEAARVDETWLRAYQNDAIMIGNVLAEQAAFVSALDENGSIAMEPSVRRIADELGVNFLQIYSPDRKLIYSSTPLRGPPLWEPGQTQAVLKVSDKRKTVLAAVGITAIPRGAPARYYLVMGSLLDQDFISELSQLTGLKTRLYYREGRNYFDIFSVPGQVQSLKGLPKEALKRLQRDKKPFYDVRAEDGRFRGQYTPVVNAQGHVEAIMFSGLERRGLDELLTNRAVLFVAISLVGILLGSGVGLLISRLVVRPVEHLRNAVLQLSGQNFDANVPVLSNDELGDLAKAFNAMAVRLRQARDEQQQTYQKDKLIALGELSAALAHEIRNPLGVINTAAALLEKPDQPESKRQELLRMVREESRRVSNLVQDFLQFSRNRPPAFAVIDPTQPLQRALAARLAGDPPVQVATDFAHGDALIESDASLLEQAWSNLVTNAIEAMGTAGGTLYLSSRREDAQVGVFIEDTGPGIDAQVMPRLFEPFFTTKPQGTGLGLSIAHTLVAANGGTLSALPRGRRGARFAMHFPVHESVAP